MSSRDGWVLVTGGAGFIGGHIAERLLEHGRRVRILDNFSTGSRNTSDLLGKLGAERFDVVEGDICDAPTVRRAMTDVAQVVHQAALPSVPRSIKDPETTHEVNATGTLRLLEAARTIGASRFVFAGSSSVYGDQGELPKRETMLPMPKSPYALSKQIGEAYCRLYHALYGLPTITLRYFNVFGPRQRPDSPYAAVIPLFAQALLDGTRPQVFGDGDQTRDFTYIANVVDANLLALDGKGPDGQVLNVACGTRTSLLELLETLGEIAGVSVDPEFLPPREGDVRDSQAAIDGAIEHLGFRPRVALDEGLRLTFEWLRTQGGLSE